MDKYKTLPAILKQYEAINKVIDRKYVKFEDTSDGIAIVDNDPNSGFYFRILQGSRVYVVERRPASSTSLISSKTGCAQTPQILDSFERWQAIIRDYQEIPKKLGIRNIEESYYKEFVSNIELLDDDVRVEPFDTAKQAFLMEYCHITKEALSKEKADGNSIEIDEIIADLSNLECNITKLTKAETADRIFRIWAKTKKVGFHLFKMISEGLLVDFAKDGVVSISEKISAAFPILLETSGKLIEKL